MVRKDFTVGDRIAVRMFVYRQRPRREYVIVPGCSARITVRLHTQARELWKRIEDTVATFAAEKP